MLLENEPIFIGVYNDLGYKFKAPWQANVMANLK